MPTQMQQRLRKFMRQPDKIGSHDITETDLAIIYKVEQYRFIPTSLLTRLVPGNSRVIERRLQILYHKDLVNRFALRRAGGECNYFLDSRTALQLLVQEKGLDPEQFDWET